jgi:glycosyltransferase involved in cell wall biosynthesis
VSDLALSVVIPTHKRAAILHECLRHIEKQTIRDKLEVIIVSDGDDQETNDLFLQEKFSFSHTFFSIPKSQQGIARNRGVACARGSVCLFIGDDMFLEERACEAHLRVHEESYGRPRLVLGYTSWDPAVGITSVMQWLDRTGWQFGYEFLKEYEHQEIPRDAQHRFTYASNISLPTMLAKRFPFTETSLYGWEDVEWGWRLAKAQVPLFYEPDAKALHHHRVTLEDSLKRMETLGRSAKYFDKMNPDLHLVPKGFKALIYRLLSFLPTTKGKHAKALLQGIGTLQTTRIGL